MRRTSPRSREYSARAMHFGVTCGVARVMAEILPAYQTVVDALSPIMRRPRGAIICIDGRDGVGKTTLGRYLAWQCNVTLIETDLFLIPTRDHIIHLDDQINRIIERRVSTHLPVIVEGISMLQMMQRIVRTPDFLIYVNNPKRSSDAGMERRLAAYEEAFAPVSRADLVVSLTR